MKKFIYSIIVEDHKGFCVEILKFVLWVLSLGYSFVIFLRTFFYKKGLLRSYHFHQPVVSVGNLTTGGSGKTPLVISIAQWLEARQKKVVILTRGYMERNILKIESDEAAMMQLRLPAATILVGPNRIQNAKEFLTDHPVDIFLLDDGFQHLQMARDLDIVTIDSTNPWGYGYLLPRGLLREPISALSRADIFILTKTNSINAKTLEIKRQLESIKPNALIIEAIHEPVRLVNVQSQDEADLLSLQDKKACSFCSIGDSQYFEWTLKNLGVNVVKNFSFMDHYLYNGKGIERIVRFCETQGTKILITTHKDAVKLKPFLNLFEGKLLYYLDIQMKITQGQELLFDRIDRLLQH